MKLSKIIVILNKLGNCFSYSQIIIQINDVFLNAINSKISQTENCQLPINRIVYIIIRKCISAKTETYVKENISGLLRFRHSSLYSINKLLTIYLSSELCLLICVYKCKLYIMFKCLKDQFDFRSLSMQILKETIDQRTYRLHKNLISYRCLEIVQISASRNVFYPTSL